MANAPDMANPPGTLAEDLATQREFLRSRSPVYAHLLDLLEAELGRGLAARLARAWEGRRFGAFYERPLLLLAALRDDALREGGTHPLWSAIVAPEPDADTASAATLAAALAPERGHFWQTLATRRLQTNEPTRAVAWLWPARLAGLRSPRPLALHDVGASAGLNLVADLLPSIWEREDGSPLPVGPTGPVAGRTGYDVSPLDAGDEADARWLRACIWPGDTDRETRLVQAIDAFRGALSRPDAPVVRRAGAADVPGLLPMEDDGRLALVYQTIVRDYVAPAEWRAYAAGLRRWLVARPPGTAMWLELELTERALGGGPPVAITAHLRGRGDVESLVLARCGPHPRRLSIDDEAAALLAERLGAASLR